MGIKNYFTKLQVSSLVTSFLVLLIQIIGITNIYHQKIDFKNSTILICFGLTILLSTSMISITFVNNGLSKEEHRKAYMDVTGIHNKRSCIEKIKQLNEKSDTFNLGIAVFDLNNLKKVNDTYGHDKGDYLIHSFADLLSKSVDMDSYLARFGGDEFIVISENTTDQKMENFIKRLNIMVQKYNTINDILLSYSVGYEISNKGKYFLVDELISLADKKMYVQKRNLKDAALIKPVCMTAQCPEKFFINVKKLIDNPKNNRAFAFLYSDISNFRFINENFGYETGNMVLDLLSQEIFSFKKSETSTRLFSDNFVSLIDITHENKDALISLIKERNDIIKSKIKNEYGINYCTINTGIYFIENHHETTDYILNCSNAARKLAKEKNISVAIYSQDIKEIERKNSEVLGNFHDALDKNEFQIYLQPQIDSLSGKICSAEALVRWVKQNGEILNPVDFISILENAGKIVELDYYVYEKVFRWLDMRHREGKELICISMNVSRLHLEQITKFISYVKDLQKKYNIDGKYLMFELTESAYIENENQANRMIYELHKSNISVSMDDFGSGYSSLKALNSIAFDEIKIDRDFLINGKNSDGKIILQEIIGLLKKLNKKIVCEGVEQKDEAIFLINKKCDIMQGYYFSKPMPINEFEELIEQEFAEIITQAIG